MEALAPYWKAVMGFLAPAAAIIISSVLEVSDGGTRVTSSEWITAFATAIFTAGTVWRVPNQARHRATDSRPTQRNI